MIGRVLGNRYEILEMIGEGGMSVVYKAKCRLLNRLVAVKILKHEFLGDNEFLERFNIESQAAASLSHPNIVSVFDVGVEGSDHYIVMEYVDGITLSQYINQNGMLPWREAVGYAIQICRALSHAHKHHIIHRDIKPHNVLMTREGQLKVTDFGIAHASTGKTVNMTHSTVGSVHYIAPEQAKGSFADERSDIYSLGVVLYEMLTARVPFTDENPVTVAIKHIQEAPVPPKDINIAVPIALQNIVLKAMAKEPNQRYQSADEMLVDLQQMLENQGSNLSFTAPVFDADRTTRIIPTVANKPAYATPAAEREQLSSRVRTVEEDAKDQPRQKKKAKKEDKKAVIWGIVASLAVILILTVVALSILYPDLFKTGAEIEVPNFVGQNIDDILSETDDKQFKFIQEEDFSADVEPGYVISQDPEAGKTMKTPIEVTLVVSKGTKEVVLANYINQEASRAKTDITNANLVYKEVQEYSDTPEGYVFNQLPPADSKVKEGSEVTIFVSKGKEVKQVTVPNLEGKSLDIAKREILANNLAIGEVQYEVSNAAKDTVTFQSLQAGTQVEEKTTINLVVSSGPNEVTKYLTVQLPQDQDETLVRLLFDGTEKYSKTHKKEEGKVDIPLKGTGRVKIDIYFGDQFQKSEVIDFTSE